MGKKILLVDDSEVALEWAKEALEALGHEIVTYSSSLGIQMTVRKEAPDVVLLDVNMPALNGDLLCRMLKQNERTKDVSILLYSSIDEEELESKAASVGADGFVRKTQKVDELREQLRKYL